MDQHSFAWTGYRASTAHSRSSSSSFSLSNLPYRCELPESNVRDALEDDADLHSEALHPWSRLATRSPSSPSLDAEVDPRSLYDSCSPSPPQFSSLQLQTSRYDKLSNNNHNNNISNSSSAYAQAFDRVSSYNHRQINSQSFSRSPSPPAAETFVSDTPEPPVLYLTEEYKALAEPMSAWIADYLVKVLSCPEYHSAQFLPSLTAFIRSVLWSTMLQPSAVFLALLYLSKFPRDFLPHQPSKDAMALKFRRALFGDDGSEDDACRKLFVCIAMLADRELHDNCFSSATWSEITHIPMSDLAALDFCSLHMLEHSLWVAPHAYYDWMAAMRHYNSSLVPEALSAQHGRRYHQIISVQIEHVISTLAAGDTSAKQPTFLKPGEQLLPQTSQEAEEEEDFELDIDLDEDGPLPEQYVPRRVSSFSSRYSSESRTTVSTPITPGSPACSSCDHENYFKPEGPQHQWLSDSVTRHSYHALSSDAYVSGHQAHRRKTSDSLHATTSVLSATSSSSSPAPRGCPTTRADFVSYSTRSQWLLS